MKKILIIAAASMSFISSSVLYAASNNCDIWGLVVDKDRLGLKVRKSPKGMMVDKIPYSKSTSVHIIDSKRGWLKINEWDIADENSYANDQEVKYARNQSRWVYGGLIGTYIRPYEGAKLYSKARKNSRIKAKVKGESLVTLVGCYRGWLEVRAKATNGRNVKGWLAPTDQCPLAFTTCP